MDIFDILKEARDPSPNRKVIRPNTRGINDYTQDVENEQPPAESEVNINTTEDNQYNDYSDEVEEVEPDQENNDYTEDVESEGNDYTQDVDSGEDDSDGNDYTEDVESEGNDYTQDVDSGEDDSEQYSDEGQQPQEELNPEELLEKQQNANLMNSVVKFYYSTKGMVDKLENVRTDNVVSNKIINRVKINFSKMTEYLYKFIMNFSNNNYVKNLYIYNYFIEAYKVNIELLRKINKIQ